MSLRFSAKEQFAIIQFGPVWSSNDQKHYLPPPAPSSASDGGAWIDSTYGDMGL